MKSVPQPHHLLDSLALEGMDESVVLGAKSCNLAQQLEIYARQALSPEEEELIKELRAAFTNQKNQPFVSESDRRRWTEYLADDSELHDNERVKIGVDAFRTALRKEEGEKLRDNNPDGFNHYVEKIRRTLKMQESHLEINGDQLHQIRNALSLPVYYMDELSKVGKVGWFNPMIIKQRLDEFSNFVMAFAANYKLHRAFFYYYDRHFPLIHICLEIFPDGFPGADEVGWDFEKFPKEIARINRHVEIIRANMYSAKGISLT